MKKLVAVVSLLTIVGGSLVDAQDTTQRDRLRDALRYGIDSQAMDAIKTLAAAWDPAFTSDLVAILDEKRPPELQKAVLDLFGDQKLRDGEAEARQILTGWEESTSPLVTAAIHYLTAVHGDGLTAALAPLVDAHDDQLAVAAIQALGNVGDASTVKLLVEKLKGTDYPDSRKSELILALGTLKDPGAVDALLAIAGNTDEEKVRRLYAADSLGKIGDQRALPVLRDMFAQKDALLRQYATGALARFNLDEVFPSLIQGLRDDDWKVREQSAKALGRQQSGAQADTAVPILSYKAASDPVSQVRVAAIGALGQIGGDTVTKRLLELYKGTATPLDSRDAALGVLADKHLAGSLETIRGVIDAEWKSYDTRALIITAKALSTAHDAALKDIFVRFLDSSDPVVRSYGARGIATNGFSDLKDRLKRMADTDPNGGTRAEAQKALAKL